MKVMIPGGMDQSQGGEKNETNIVEINGIGSLPRDLIVEILSILPVKTLCKFRCVSKQWLYLLSNDKHFITQHWQRSIRKPILLFRKYYSSKKDEDDEKNGVMVELTSIDLDGTILNKIKASINGPVYTFSSCGPLVILPCPYSLYVYNPSNQQVVPVPSSSVSRYYTMGFGYLPKKDEKNHAINEYKIVHLFYPNSIGEKLGCEIFTLTHGGGVHLGSWRRIQDCPYKILINGLTASVNGTVYWMVSELSNKVMEKSILSFDLERENFKIISCPKLYLVCEDRLLFLIGFKGCLCLVDCFSVPSRMEIWLLKDQSNCFWVREKIISLSGLGANIEIRGVVPSDDLDDTEILINTEQKGLVYCNIENGSFRLVSSDVQERYKQPCLYYDGFFSLHPK